MCSVGSNKIKEKKKWDRTHERFLSLYEWGRGMADACPCLFSGPEAKCFRSARDDLVEREKCSLLLLLSVCQAYRVVVHRSSKDDICLVTAHRCCLSPYINTFSPLGENPARTKDLSSQFD